MTENGPLGTAVPVGKKEINIVVIGDTDIGKTAFVNAITGNRDEPVLKTYGVDFKQVTRGNFRVLVWDTPGEQRFRSHIKAIYHKASVLVLAFDSTNA
jgi:small GTP-binding protein